MTATEITNIANSYTDENFNATVENRAKTL